MRAADADSGSFVHSHSREESRGLFNYCAPAVGTVEILATFSASARDHKLLVILWRAGAVVFRGLIVMVSVHWLDAEDFVVAGERRVRGGSPTPANVNVCHVAGKGTAYGDGLNVCWQPRRPHRPRHTGEERVVIQIPRNRGDPHIVDRIERGGRAVALGSIAILALWKDADPDIPVLKESQSGVREITIGGEASLWPLERQRMTPEEWHKVKEVLQTALELDPGARAGFLDSAGPPENSLRGEVESLLRSHHEDRVSLEQPVAIDPASLLVTTSPATWIGRRLGPYELLEQIGEGGMGAVPVSRHPRAGVASTH